MSTLKQVNILLVAMDSELEAILKKYDGKRVNLKTNQSAICYNLNLSSSWIVIKTGVGHINTTMCLTELAMIYSIKNIIQFGVGGSISQKVNTGDYVIGDKIIQHDAIFIDDNSKSLMGTGQLYLSRTEELPTFNISSEEIREVLTSFCKENRLTFHIGNIASGSSFISSNNLKKETADYTDSIMVEMESSAAAYFCEINNIKYGFIKICSDSLKEDSHIEYIDFINENIKNAANLLGYCDENIH